MLEKRNILPRYEFYKDSGIEWLGKIPEHWEPLANKYIFKLRKNKVGKRSDEYDLLSLTLKGIIKRDMENPEGKFPAEFDTYQEVNPGDFVFCLFDVEETPRAVGLSSFYGMITGAYTVFEACDNFNKSFLYYFYLNLDSRKMMKPLYKGLRNTIPKEHFFDFKTFTPPVDEQAAIAKFLDRKTTQIDQAIALKEQQITLLKERKKSCIVNAVTRGVNSAAPMRDSGVEWIGDIPAHWCILPGFCFFSENKRTNKGMIETQVLSLSYGRIIIKPEEKLIGLVPESFETYQIVEPGDIIIRCTDLQNDKTSLRTGIAKDTGIITSAYLNLKVLENNIPEYLYYFLHALDLTKEIYKHGSGLRQNLSYYDFKRMPILSVPIKEQTAIVNHIEAESAKIGKAIDLQQQQINCLKEYKSTLINSAVTGKIKVA